MITTLNPMLPSALPRARARSPIIAALSLSLSLALLLALAGCSMLKLGYSQASPLVFRWLDGYVDFDDAQAERVRAALDEAIAWHRRSQLPDYVELLARAQAEAAGDATPERMCAWGRELRARIDPVAQYLAPTIAEIALTLTPAQIAHIEKRYASNNDEWRDEHWQREPKKRQRAAVQREIERAENFYGKLDGPQRELVAHAVAASYLQRLDHSPRDGYRAYAERLAAHNCSFASDLHNATNAAQRRAAALKLKGFEIDLRELIADSAG
jgi:hypothetical protein